MKLFELLRPWLPIDDLDSEILGLQQDSRWVKKGDLFLAYPGMRADGRYFMREAERAGAVAILYEAAQMPSCAMPLNCPAYPLIGLYEKLPLMAASFFNHPGRSLHITGVTGTNGKTTIAYQLTAALELLAEKAVYMGTLGSGLLTALQSTRMTTPNALSLQGFLADFVNEGFTHLCMEVSSHALKQGRVEGLNFSEAIFTNLTHDHLDYHLDMNDYAAAKAKLFAKPLKTMIINQDDAYAGFMKAQAQPSTEILSYGLNQDADVRVLTYQLNGQGSLFEVQSPWGRHQIETQMIGLFNIYNSLAVLSSLWAQGYASSDVVSLMSRLSGVPGRMERVFSSPLVMVDYAHTPDALKKVLLTLNQIKTGVLILVFGCGGDRDKEKRPVMGRIAEEYADRVILTNDNSRHEKIEAIMGDILGGFKNPQSVAIEPDREQAIQMALKRAQPDDIVLVAGKGHESYQDFGDHQRVFSDQKCIKIFYGID